MYNVHVDTDTVFHFFSLFTLREIHTHVHTRERAYLRLLWDISLAWEMTRLSMDAAVAWQPR